MTDSEEHLKPEGEADGTAPTHFRRFAREWAMQFLFQCDVSGDHDLAAEREHVEELLQLFWTQLEESGQLPDGREYRRGRKGADELVRGVLDNLRKLDDLIASHSEKWTLDRMSPVDRNVMRVAAYEMLFNEKVPKIVSIDQAVEIGKQFGSEQTGSFVNGILNSIKNQVEARK